MKESQYTLQVHHVGGRDGELGELPLNPVFKDDILYHIYDSDESCMPQVAAISRSRGLNFKLHPYIVDKLEGESSFTLNHCPCTSSLLPAAEFRPAQYSALSLMGDYRYRDAFRPVKTLKVASITLDEYTRRKGYAIDFLSVDAQGGEARVFQGAEEQLTRQTVGILCEVEFHELYEGQPLFGDIHAMLRDKGYNFMRLFTREARVNYFRAGIGFRGDGILMSADALFLRDPIRLESELTTPEIGLLKLAFVAMSFGYVEYSLDCLERAFGRHGIGEINKKKSPAYVRFLDKVWRLYESSPFITPPSFAEIFSTEEAQRRFQPDNPHPWSTFDRERVLRTYFSKIDIETFQDFLPTMLDQEDTEFEKLLKSHGMDAVAETVRQNRIKHSTLTVDILNLGTKIGNKYRLHVAEELNRLGLISINAQYDLPAEKIDCEVKRLSRLSGWKNGPKEGWQYPFDLGHGIIAPTYTEVQMELHPWRRNVLVNNLDRIFGARYHQLSILDLGACEGAMALALWERGVRDITCVEARKINVEKARFVFKVKNADIIVVQDNILDFLRRDDRHYDIVLFMGVLYHLLDPFLAMRLTAQRTRGVLAMETVVANPNDLEFDNVAHYRPSSGGFFIRHDSALCNTAGLNDLELWPNRQGLEMLLYNVGFTDIREMDYGPDPISWYATRQRVMLLASHQ